MFIHEIKMKHITTNYWFTFTIPVTSHKHKLVTVFQVFPTCRFHTIVYEAFNTDACKRIYKNATQAWTIAKWWFPLSRLQALLKAGWITLHFCSTRSQLVSSSSTFLVLASSCQGSQSLLWCHPCFLWSVFEAGENIPFIFIKGITSYITALNYIDLILSKGKKKQFQQWIFKKYF